MTLSILLDLIKVILQLFTKQSIWRTENLEMNKDLLKVNL